MRAFNDLCETSRAKDEKRDCAVIAIAIATDTPYQEVYDLCAAEGRRTNCGTSEVIINRVLKRLGYYVDRSRKYVSEGSTMRSVEGALPEDGAYLVYTSGHVACVRNGKVEDWTAGRRHRVEKVMRVLPIGEKMDNEESMYPSRPRFKTPPQMSVKERIHAEADRMWSAAGNPRGLNDLLRLRIRIMDELQKQGIKRTTASSELGKWQKVAIFRAK